jgi:flagellar biosynthesis protein FlhF
MRIKKYTTKSMKEALIQIRQELGEDAIILKTTRAPGKLFSQGGIEVTAAIDEESGVSHQAFAPLRVSDTGVYRRPKPEPEIPHEVTEFKPKQAQPSALEALAALSKESVAERRKAAELPGKKPHLAIDQGAMENKYEEIKADIRELKHLFGAMVKSGDGSAAGGFTGEWAVLYKKLADAEVPQDVAAGFVARVQANSSEKDGDVVKKFMAELGVCFQASAPAALKNKKPVFVMFVGPTGMGKTTTLAKLAAYHVLNKRKSVAVITADTYRIAAIEQIRTFTEIMGIDLHIVFSPDEAREAMDACASHDLVFVDTAGRSQKSAEHMQELSGLIQKMKPDDVHLVLSAGTKVSDLLSAVEKYRSLGINRLLFTKLDETMKLGNVLTTAIQTRIPFSYFTFGQRVPDDIELAQPQRLVQRLFEGSGL